MQLSEKALKVVFLKLPLKYFWEGTFLVIVKSKDCNYKRLP